jgi:hypothetical protein
MKGKNTDIHASIQTYLFGERGREGAHPLPAVVRHLPQVPLSRPRWRRPAVHVVPEMGPESVTKLDRGRVESSKPANLTQ